jgi:enterochelin esterase-like enzyme
MNKVKVLVAVLLLLTLLAGCAAPLNPIATPILSPSAASASPAPSKTSPPAASPSASAAVSKAREPEVYQFNLKIPAPSLKENLVSEPAENRIYVVLPRSYYSSEKRYPTLYSLHGYSENYQSLVQMLDTYKMSKTGEFILVGINGTNKLGGSFYADSPVTGGWEKHVAEEVVRYVDENYRTIAKPESRGLTGFSMGASGTINIGLKHPDVFTAIYPMSPGLFDKNGLKKAMNDWDPAFEASYGAAFSPAAGKDPPYTVPKLDGSKADKAVVANWENGFGNLENKIKAYLEKGVMLKGIRIVCGKNDGYTWIPEGCVYFDELLKKNNIAHDLIMTNGTHSVDYNRLNGDMLEFFTGTLLRE